jgi:hypothetical protein
VAQCGVRMHPELAACDELTAKSDDRVFSAHLSL